MGDEPFLLPGVSASATGSSEVVTFAALSGMWIGREASYQAGECFIGARGRRHEARPLDFVLDVASDGSFTLTLQQKHGGSPDADQWVGRFDGDLRFAVAEPAHATCDGVARDYSIVFSGKALRKRNRLTMEMEGMEGMCPEMKCRFRLVIRAKKR